MLQPCRIAAYNVLGLSEVGKNDFPVSAVRLFLGFCFFPAAIARRSMSSFTRSPSGSHTPNPSSPHCHRCVQSFTPGEDHHDHYEEQVVSDSNGNMKILSDEDATKDLSNCADTLKQVGDISNWNRIIMDSMVAKVSNSEVSSGVIEDHKFHRLTMNSWNLSASCVGASHVHDMYASTSGGGIFEGWLGEGPERLSSTRPHRPS